MRKRIYVLVLSVLIFLPTHAVLAEDATSTPETISSETATSTEEVLDTSTASSTGETASSTPETASSTALTIEGHVDVPAACTVVDTDGISHDYLAASSTAYIGICALVVAKDDGLISDFQATNFSFGLFVTSIHDIAADPSSQFWALYLNGDFPSVGLTDLPVAAGDTIELKLQDFGGNDIGDSLTLHIEVLIATSTATSTPTASDAATSTPPTVDDSNNTDTSSGGGSPSTGSGSSSSGSND